MKQRNVLAELRDHDRGGLRVVAEDELIILEYQIVDISGSGWYSEDQYKFTLNNEGFNQAMLQMARLINLNCDHDFYSGGHRGNRDGIVIELIDHNHITDVRIIDTPLKLFVQAFTAGLFDARAWESVEEFENSETGLEKAMRLIADHIVIAVKNDFYILPQLLKNLVPNFLEIQRLETLIETSQRLIDGTNKTPTEEWIAKELIQIAQQRIADLKKGGA